MQFIQFHFSHCLQSWRAILMLTWMTFSIQLSILTRFRSKFSWIHERWSICMQMFDFLFTNVEFFLIALFVEFACRQKFVQFYCKKLHAITTTWNWIINTKIWTRLHAMFWLHDSETHMFLNWCKRDFQTLNCMQRLFKIFEWNRLNVWVECDDCMQS